MAILLGILFGTAQITLDVFETKARVGQTVSQILDIVEHPAARAAFQLNEAMGDEVLAGLFAYEFIRRAEILDDDGQRLAEVSRPLQNGFLSDISRWLFADIESHTVALRTDDQAELIGRLTLELDPFVIAVGVIHRAAVTIVVGVAWISLFTILLLYKFHLTLTKPLKSIVERFHAVDHDAPETILFPVPEGHEQDELGTLVETINKYFARLDKTRRNLRTTEERYEGLFENTEVPMWNADLSAAAATLSRLRQDGVSDLRDYLAANDAVRRELAAGILITGVNEAALSLFKAKTENIFIRGFDETIPPGDGTLLVDELCAIWDQQKLFRSEATLRTLDGKDINVIISFRIPGTEDAFGRIPVSVINITRMKESERELSENLARIEMTLEANNAGAWSWDMETNKTIWSEENYRLLGYRPGELDPDFDAWLSRVHPDDQEFATGQVERAIAENSRLDFEYRAIMPDGSIRWIQDIGSFVKDDDGTVLGMYGVQIDNTKRKLLEAELTQSQKMEAVGHLTGGVAHDFNNLLQVILGNLELALDSLDKDDKSKRFLSSALRAGQRGAALTHQLLAFSRKQTLNPEVVNPGAIVGGMLEFLQRTLGDSIEIEPFYEDGISMINVDPNNLQNAILNIAINAKAAMPRGGTLSVSTKRKHLKKTLDIEGGRLPVGDYVEISVADTGCGMSEKTLEHAFEPFYTTKDIGEGSGLGLSMVYGFVRQSGGTVTLTSELNKGTTVTLMFPVNKAGPVKKMEKRRIVEPERGEGKILVVEDDPDVCSTVIELISRQGYETRDAKNAFEALEILANDDSIDLLFSDVMMPKGMNGSELAHEATRINKNLKVLLTSGYPNSELERLGFRVAGFDFLRKPYSNEQLIEALNSVLAKYSSGRPEE